MAIFKCKMCGGSLDVAEGTTVCECEYCGTQQTIPKLHDDVMTNLFNRANHLRSKCEFDKAQEIYEKIVSQNPTEAEAYWGIILCKYGIEYVEDPATFRKIPTCHRTQLESVQADADYLSALQNADTLQKEVYEREAAEIDRLQRDILNIVRNEKPFDVFICYKETDDSGKRTQDSVIANDIYHQLTQEGFKVFYAAITLEDKLGEAYEPYIFAALNSAKVMLVLGTKPEYFTAVWVRNEWSRYLQLAKKDHSRLLIPCYRDMDAYDLPDEFSHLQAQDMGKIGFINDVIRGIKKVLEKPDEQKTVRETIIQTGNANTAPLLKRAKMFLEDGDWKSAEEYCNKVLDLDPECSQAYYFLLMAQLHIHTDEEFEQKKLLQGIAEEDNFQMAVRFADEREKEKLTGLHKQILYNASLEMLNNSQDVDQWYHAAVNFRSLGTYSNALKNTETAYERIYEFAVSKAGTGENKNDLFEAAKQFERIVGYKDSAQKAQEYREKAETIRAYDYACSILKNNLSTVEELETAKKNLESIQGWLDADQLAEECKMRIAEVTIREQAKEESKKQHDFELQKKKKRQKKVSTIAIITVIVIVVSVIFVNMRKMGRFVAFPEENKVWLVAGSAYTVGLKSDGTVVATGRNEDGQCDVSDWNNIVVISARYKHTVGLKADGTVVTTGNNKDGQCDVSGWSDIVAVAAGYNHTVGLKADKTVVATGYNKDGQCDVDVSDWSDIVAIAAGNNHTVGLKADGTVVATGDNDYGQCNVTDWSDVVAVAAGWDYTVGLKTDGTVVTTGDNKEGQCDVSDWNDIVAISAGNNHTVGLKADGTIVTTGNNESGQCNVSDWSDIVAVAAGSFNTVGLKADGTVVVAGGNAWGQCNVFGWSDIVVATAVNPHTFGLRFDGKFVAKGSRLDGHWDATYWANIGSMK